MNTIGIDIGGTNIRAAIVSDTGDIIQCVKQPTEINLGVEHVMCKLKSMIRSLDGYESCVGIGLGVPGPVDTVKQELLLSSNLPGFAKYPVGKEIEDTFHLPTFMDNDANVAGLGEALQGAGKGYASVYYVTISTGIGGAFINNGLVVAGKHGHAGEIGNLVIDRHREKINKLNAGAVECEASGTAITRKGQRSLDVDIAHAGDVFEQAQLGNEEALRIVDEMSYDLALMFSMIAHVVDPAIFVVGGGVMKGKNLFFDKMLANYQSLVHEGMKSVPFVVASLEEPGIIGAAMLPVANKIRSEN